jgi:hypothetical protein
MSNPFHHRGIVTGLDFYNCEDELDELITLTSAPVPISVNIYPKSHYLGRLGTTSFLRHFCQVTGPKHHPLWNFEYIDFLGIRTRKELYKRLCKALRGTGDSAEAVNEAVASTHQRTYIALDHFDLLLHKSTEFDADFFAHLRGVASGSEIGLIITSSRPLKKLPIPWPQDSTSPFHNIFNYIPLEQWPTYVCKAFLQERTSKTSHTFTTEDINFIVSNLQKQTPYHLQVLGYHYYQAKLRGFNDEATVLRAYRNEIKNSRNIWHKIASLPTNWKVVGGMLITSIVVISLWLTLGLQRTTSTYLCEDGAAGDKYMISMAAPKYLATGDLGQLELTIHNQSKNEASPLVIIDFSEPVHLDNNTSTLMSFEPLGSSERKTGTLDFYRANKETIEVDASVQLQNSIILCNITPPQSAIMVKRGFIPYLNTIWVWLGTTGPIGLLYPFISAWLKKRMES